MDPLLPKKGECEGCSDVTKLQMRDDDKKEVIEVRKGVKDYPELKKKIEEKLSKK